MARTVITSAPRTLLLALAALVFLACGAVAQRGAAPAGADLAAPAGADVAAPAGADVAAPAATPAQPDTARALQALTDVLRDDAARAALLEALSAADPPPPPADEGAAPAADPAPEESARPEKLGPRLAAAMADLAHRVEVDTLRFTAGLRATTRRLGQLQGERLDRLIAVAIDVAWIVGLTMAINLAAGALAKRSHAAMRRAASKAAVPRRVLVWTAVLVIDALTVIVAWAIGNGLAIWLTGNGLAADVNATLYLNAFLGVQLTRVVIRSLFAPRTPEIRPLPFTDAGARAWSLRIGVLIAVLGYGLMFVTPVVDREISLFVGAAVEVVVYSVVLIGAMAMVLRHRRAPSAWLRARSETAGDATLRLTAWLLQYWHVPTLFYLLILFQTAVSRSGVVGPMLRTTVTVFGVLLVGGLVEAGIGRLARNGLSVPGEIAARIPNLETRLNAFVRSARKAARFVVIVVTLGAAVDVSGLVDTGGWFTAVFGDDFAGALVSVSLILVAAFLLWLAMASWVDYRLNPDQQMAATARQQTLLTLLRNAATVAIIVFTTMFALSELGLDIAPLIASAGVLGLAIGFGAQRLVQDIITGIFIQFESAINVGDVVTVAGTTGSVEKLTVRSVSLRALDGTFHIIPFSSVDMVSNFNRGFAFHVADMGIAYREDVDHAKALMFAAFDDLKANPEQGRNVLGALEWFGVNALGDNAVTLRARIRTRPGAQWGVGRLYNELVKKRFDAEGVEIPFPQRTLWFGESRDGKAPPARVVAETTARPAPVATAAPTQIEAHPTADAPPDVDGDGR